MATRLSITNNATGILRTKAFEQYIHMERYDLDDPELSQLVDYIFIARYDIPVGQTVITAEILDLPHIYLLFTLERAYVLNITSNVRQLYLTGAGVYVGIRFAPGGFSPFFGTTLDNLAIETTLTDIFEGLEPAWPQQLLRKTDTEICHAVKQLLKERIIHKAAYFPLITTCMSAIIDDPTVTPAILAECTQYSVRQLEDIFKKYVGASIKWTLKRHRLLQAVQKIHHGATLSWTDLAYDLGYSSQSHFINDFRSVIGVSPATYVKDYAQPVMASSAKTFEDPASSL